VDLRNKYANRMELGLPLRIMVGVEFVVVAAITLRVVAVLVVARTVVPDGLASILVGDD
jgi:hypothetical protein